MIIGSGQLSHYFSSCDKNDVLIFASGVSNSNCIDRNEFDREKNILLNALSQNKDKIIVYFSSCALSSPEYPKNLYYQHKQEMEYLIQYKACQYYIFRLPQLFGKFKQHKTIINYLYNSILHGEKMQIYSEAYRYVIEIDDVRKLVDAFIRYSPTDVVVDLGNPYRYKVLEIVRILEKIIGKRAYYNLVQRSDGYYLSFTKMKEFIADNSLEFNFSEYYLYEKLKQHHMEIA